MRKAFITGITGQDGSYLAQQLLNRGYQVHGLVRRSSVDNLQRIEHIKSYVTLHKGDLTKGETFRDILMDVDPDYIFNLAAQSHVGISFEQPLYTVDVDALGLLRILNYVKNHNQDCRVYQASTSEMFGNNPAPQSEDTEFDPESPYACAKVFAHNLAKNYREAYDLHISCGILFNHESCRRPDQFVTSKIAKQAVEVVNGDRDIMYLGNLNAKRDWGFAPDYTRAMYYMTQQDKPDDYVIATGDTHSVRDFVELAFSQLDISISWEGKGINEVGVNKDTDKVLVAVSEEFYRPCDVHLLQGDYSKAREKLNWEPQIGLSQLVEIMVGAYNDSE